MQQVGTRPGHPVEGQHPQGPPRHIDPVTHRVGAKQAAVLLRAEDIHQRPDLQRIDVLGVKGNARLGQVRPQSLIHGLQPANGGE
ncbi:hypothetical protein D3C87_1887790 [compost metagenome]